MVKIKRIEVSGSSVNEALVPYIGSETKIQRAKEHIKEFEKLAADYIAANPLTIDMLPATTRRVSDRNYSTTFSFNWKLEGAPPLMSVVLGDIFHNLRSAIDLALCEFCKSDKVRFPFCETEGELTNTIKGRTFGLAGANGERLIRELQPYKGGNINLRALHDLNVQDKHKLLIPSGAAFNIPPVKFASEDGKILLDMNGNPIPEFFTDSDKPPPVTLIFPPDSPLAGQEIVETLHRLVETAASLVESFKLLGGPVR